MKTFLVSTIFINFAVALLDKDQTSKLSCYLISSWTIFDLRPLQKIDSDY